MPAEQITEISKAWSQLYILVGGLGSFALFALVATEFLYSPTFGEIGRGFGTLAAALAVSSLLILPFAFL